jgi:hypothetical protein
MAAGDRDLERRSRSALSRMKEIRLALGVIGVAYAVLGLVVILFAVSVARRVDIGQAYLSVMVLGWGGTLAVIGLLAGSVLGTLALVRHASTRRAWHVLVILSGWIAALVLGWLVWEFWTNSALPHVSR